MYFIHLDYSLFMLCVNDIILKKAWALGLGNNSYFYLGSCITIHLCFNSCNNLQLLVKELLLLFRCWFHFLVISPFSIFLFHFPLPFHPKLFTTLSFVSKTESKQLFWDFYFLKYWKAEGPNIWGKIRIATWNFLSLKPY